MQNKHKLRRKKKITMTKMKTDEEEDEAEKRIKEKEIYRGRIKEKDKEWIETPKRAPTSRVHRPGDKTHATNQHLDDPQQPNLRASIVVHRKKEEKDATK